MGLSNVYGVPGVKSPRGEASVIDGKAVAAQLRLEVADKVRARVEGGSSPPRLATILVGEDEASQVYVGAKHRACAEAGIESVDHRLAAATPPAELAQLIARLNADPQISGILLQLPLPAPLEGAAFVDLIDPGKDVDGLSTASTGALWRSQPGLRPCTPAGIVELLRHVEAPLAGADVTIVGRSELVGRPLAALLLAEDATVTVCHSRSRALATRCKHADIVVAACGRPRLIGADHLKPGAVVIDVGINRIDGELVGDVDYEQAVARAGAITPVPGGVGPMTIAMLLHNTLRAAEAR